MSTKKVIIGIIKIDLAEQLYWFVLDCTGVCSKVAIECIFTYFRVICYKELLKQELSIMFCINAISYFGIVLLMCVMKTVKQVVFVSEKVLKLIYNHSIPGVC